MLHLRNSRRRGGVPAANYLPPPPTGGDNPNVTVETLSLTSKRIGLTAVPAAGTSIVAYEVRRSIDGITSFVDVATLQKRRVSELPARSTTPPTKWVHPSGTLDGNVAYTSVPEAMAAAIPGDEIVVDGDYTSGFVWTTPGTVGNQIRIRPFNYDNPPTFDGQNVLPLGWSESGFATGSTSLINIQAAYVILDGILVKNSKQHGIATGACNNNGSFFNVGDPWYPGIEVYRCKVENCDIGLLMWKTEGPKFGGNDFSKCQRYQNWEVGAGNPSSWGYAVNMAGRDVWFVENIIRQTMGEGIHLGHHINVTAGNNQGANTKGFTIRGNIIYDCWSDPIYAAVGTDGIIEENLVFMSANPRFWYNRSASTGYPQYCIGIGGELGAYSNPTTVYDSDYAGLRDIKIRNNIFNGANRLVAFKRFEDPHKTKNIEFDHNTIYCPKGAFASIYEALNNIQTSANEMTGIKMRSNAVAVADGSYVSRIWNSLPATGKDVSGNFFSHTPPADISSGTDIIDPSSTILTNKNYSAPNIDWPLAITFDEDSAAPYYQAGGISRLVNAVAPIAGITRDYYGNTRDTTSGFVDIGAISLSKPLTITYDADGLSSGQAYYFSARFVQSDGFVTPWSAGVQG